MRRCVGRIVASGDLGLWVGVAVASVWLRSVDEQFEHLADGPLLADCPAQWEIAADVVAVAPAFLFFDDIAGVGELGDDAERAALGDAERGGDVAEAHARIVRDADERSGVVGEEAPLGHGHKTRRRYLETDFLRKE